MYDAHDRQKPKPKRPAPKKDAHDRVDIRAAAPKKDAHDRARYEGQPLRLPKTDAHDRQKPTVSRHLRSVLSDASTRTEGQITRERNMRSRKVAKRAPKKPRGAISRFLDAIVDDFGYEDAIRDLKIIGRGFQKADEYSGKALRAASKPKNWKLVVENMGAVNMPRKMFEAIKSGDPSLRPMWQQAERDFVIPQIKRIRKDEADWQDYLDVGLTYGPFAALHTAASVKAATSAKPFRIISPEARDMVMRTGSVHFHTPAVKDDFMKAYGGVIPEEAHLTETGQSIIAKHFKRATEHMPISYGKIPSVERKPLVRLHISEESRVRDPGVKNRVAIFIDKRNGQAFMDHTNSGSHGDIRGELMRRGYPGADKYENFNQAWMYQYSDGAGGIELGHGPFSSWAAQAPQNQRGMKAVIDTFTQQVDDTMLTGAVQRNLQTLARVENKTLDEFRFPNDASHAHITNEQKEAARFRVDRFLNTAVQEGKMDAGQADRLFDVLYEAELANIAKANVKHELWPPLRRGLGDTETGYYGDMHERVAAADLSNTRMRGGRIPDEELDELEYLDRFDEGLRSEAEADIFRNRMRDQFRNDRLWERGGWSDPKEQVEGLSDGLEWFGSGGDPRGHQKTWLMFHDEMPMGREQGRVLPEVDMTPYSPRSPRNPGFAAGIRADRIGDLRRKFPEYGPKAPQEAPKWNPERVMLAKNGRIEGGDKIWVMDHTTGNRKQVTFISEEPSKPSDMWHGPGERSAIVEDHLGNRSRIQWDREGQSYLDTAPPANRNTGIAKQQEGVDDEDYLEDFLDGMMEGDEGDFLDLDDDIVANLRQILGEQMNATPLSQSATVRNNREIADLWLKSQQSEPFRMKVGDGYVTAPEHTPGIGKMVADELEPDKILGRIIDIQNQGSDQYPKLALRIRRRGTGQDVFSWKPEELVYRNAGGRVPQAIAKVERGPLGEIVKNPISERNPMTFEERKAFLRQGGRRRADMRTAEREGAPNFGNRGMARAGHQRAMPSTKNPLERVRGLGPTEKEIINQFDSTAIRKTSSKIMNGDNFWLPTHWWELDSLKQMDPAWIRNPLKLMVVKHPIFGPEPVYLLHSVDASASAGGTWLQYIRVADAAKPGWKQSQSVVREVLLKADDYKGIQPQIRAGRKNSYLNMAKSSKGLPPEDLERSRTAVKLFGAYETQQRVRKEYRKRRK